MSHTRILSIPLLVLLALSSFAQGATVATGILETEYDGPGVTSINTSTSVTRNMSDLTGLTPGQSIVVEFTPDAPVFWEGFLRYPAGELQLTWQATVEINVDGNILTYIDTWTLGPSIVPEAGPSGVFGEQLGPDRARQWLVVPWGTDLSDITVTLRDLTSISGGIYEESSMSLSGTLRTGTVPEPSVILFCLAFPAALLLRRRR